MSYEASIYVCLLALTGALVAWILPATLRALGESLARYVRPRLPRRPSPTAGAPAPRLFGGELPRMYLR